MAIALKKYFYGLGKTVKVVPDELDEGVIDGADGATPLLFHILADQAGAATKSLTLKRAVRVVDVWCVNKAIGGAADTITVRNGATAITDAMDTNIADEATVRAGTMDDAERDIAAGGTLVVLKANGAQDQDVDVYVLAYPTA